MATGQSAEHPDAPEETAGPRVPKYWEVKRQLLDMISGLRPGAPLPPERELARHYAASRTTVRQALAELAVEGRLRRAQGRGTFAARPKVAKVLELSSYADHLLAHGLTPQTRLLEAGYLAADAQLAGLLGLPPGGRVLSVRRLRLADGEPMAIDLSYLPARRFPGLRRALTARTSLYELLAARYGVELAEAEETIETVLAGPAEAGPLQVDPGLPLLLLSRHAFDTTGAPVEWAQARYRGDRYKFVTRLRRRPADLPPGTPGYQLVASPA